MVHLKTSKLPVTYRESALDITDPRCVFCANLPVAPEDFIAPAFGKCNRAFGDLLFPTNARNTLRAGFAPPSDAVF